MNKTIVTLEVREEANSFQSSPTYAVYVDGRRDCGRETLAQAFERIILLSQGWGTLDIALGAMR